MKFIIELKPEDFYQMLEDRCQDDIDWSRMTKLERADFKQTLLDGIVKQLSKKSFLTHMKDFMLDWYWETDLEEFLPLMDKACEQANKRIEAEEKAKEEKDLKEEKVKELAAEKRLYKKLKKKFDKKGKSVKR